jgi:DNA polymerase epsilon subunit 2
MQDGKIHGEFSAFGLALQRDALICLRNFINSTASPSGTLQDVLTRIPSVSSDTLVPKTVIQEIIDSIKTSASPTHHVFAFQNAFDMPKFAFDATDRLLERKPKQSFLGSANDKTNMFLERYQILKTSLLTKSLFHSTSFVSAGTSYALTPIGSLLSVSDTSVIVLGFLDCDGKEITIADPPGTMKLNISEVTHPIGIFCVGSIAVVQGEFRDDTIFASLIGHPPSTSYASFESHFWRLPTDLFGWELTKSAMAELSNMLNDQHKNSLALFLSDVWLDIPSVLDDLNHVLSTFDKSPPNLLIITGSFTSRPFSFAEDFHRLFERFVQTMKQHPAILENSQVVIVPSIWDFGSPKVFPRPAFPQSLQSLLPSAHFMSNPCRLRFLNQTFLIYRDDLLKRMGNAAVLPPPERKAHKAMLRTIIDQRHLCPMDLEHGCISWNFDHAMRLFPQPDVLAVCEASPAWSEKYEGCCAFNPGQLSQGTYAQYLPFERRADIRAIG